MILVLLATVLFSHAQPIEDFSSDPRWVVISSKVFSSNTSKILGQGFKSNCPAVDQTAYLAKEEEIKSIREKFRKTLDDSRKKSPSIDSLEDLLVKYPKLKYLLDQIRVETEKQNKLREPSEMCAEKEKEEAFAKIKDELPIFESPDPKAKKLGVIEFSVNPSNGVKVDFRDPAGKVEEFPVDVDRAYDVYFTVLAQKGNWVKLPRNPFPTPGWVQLKSSAKATPIRALESTLFVSTPSFQGEVVLEKIEGGNYIGRVANKNDSPCPLDEDGNMREEKEIKPIPIKIPVKEFFDKDQHVKVRRGPSMC